MPPPSPRGARTALTLDIKGRIMWLLKPSADSGGHSLASWAPVACIKGTYKAS
ncbi:hypothetical protein ACRRTK_018580 [Alexandromys fortis]